MNKHAVALAAAILMTACVGVSILAIGGFAFFNPNGVQAANSPSQIASDPLSSNVSAAQQSQDQAQIQQLQNLIAQYQQREQQYQQREQQYQQQLQQANQQVQQAQTQMQQVQMLLAALQQRGIITITTDGRIFINSGGGLSGEGGEP